jgi:hypothetical protein
MISATRHPYAVNQHWPKIGCIRRVSVWAVLVLLGGAGPVVALDTTWSIKVSSASMDENGGLTQDVGHDTIPYANTIASVSGEEGFTPNFSVCEAGAAVNAGSAATAAFARAGGAWGPVPGGSQILANCEAATSFEVDDFMVTGGGGLVDAYLNLDLSGFQDQTTELIPVSGNVLGSTSARVFVHVEIGGQAIQTRKWITTSQETGQAPDVTVVFLDPELDVALPATIGIGPFQVTANQAFDLKVVLLSDSLSQWFGINGGSGLSETVVDYGSTLSLSTSGPVFDLPVGFTASSISADVVDNTWLGSPVDPVIVPEPGRAVTLFAGGIGLVLLQRDRRARAM